MGYRVELMPRARRDLARIYRHIHADDAAQARAWLVGLEALVFSLDEHPARGAVTPENENLRQLFYGHKPDTYRIIYAVDQRHRVVNVIHIRHGARDRFTLKETDSGRFTTQ